MRPGKQTRVLAALQQSGVRLVSEEFAQRLSAELRDVGERALRAALIASGLPLAPLVEGVRQDSPEHLERTLIALAAEYESGDRDRRRAIRQLVITARRHALFNVARHPEKAEMALWMLTWLENPPLFATWLELRRRAHTRA